MSTTTAAAAPAPAPPPPAAPARTAPSAPAAVPGLPVRTGAFLSLAVALLVTLGELSRLTGQVLDVRGHAWAIGSLLGPGRLLEPLSPGWSATFGDGGGARRGWVAAYVVVDVVLVALYGVVLARRLHAVWPGLARLLRVVAVADLAACAGALGAGVVLDRAPAPLALLVGLVAGAKWLLATLGGLLVLRRLAGPDGRAWVRRWGRALVTQRFSVLVVLPLAVLGIPGGSDLLDQIPDVQRRWLADGRGALHAAVAVVVVLVVTLATFLLGRLRSGVLWRRTALSVETEAPAVLRLGLVAPAVVVVGLAVAWSHGDTAPWDLPGLLPLRALAFTGVPLVIVVGSYAVRRHLRHLDAPAGAGWFVPARHPVPGDEEKSAMVLTGDLVAVTALVVGGLGLVRSMTAIVALEGTGRLAFSPWGTLAWVVGIVVTVAAWPVGRLLVDACTDDDLPQRPGLDSTVDVHHWYAGLSRPQRLRALLTPSAPTPRRLWVRVTVLLTGIVLFFAVGYYPVWFATWVGVIGTALLALLAGALVVGGSVVAIQDRLAPELFWARPIRLATLPVTTILLGTVVLATSIGNSIDVHGVRAGLSASPTATPRPTMSRAVDAWVDATRGCGHQVTVDGRVVTLRPMLLLAAEGGGIRAAYWTAAGLDLVRGLGRATGAGTIDWSTGAENPCARALFGGGASGGAVGLTVARFAGASSARDRVVAMAGPDALGAATSGLFVRDLAYAATGVPFFGAPETALGGRPTRWPWNDRAALIEHSWESTSGLGVPFLDPDPRAAAGSETGALVLNSTRVADGCRMWVSQLDLQAGGTDCDGPTAPAGHTLDLFAALAPGRGGGSQCLGNPTAATATMLASRFPFVTPSGVVGPCGGQPEQQLVDGGYVENSGLKTIVDLVPDWLTEVQHRNAAALAGTGPADLIVPVVTYLDNGTGSDLVTDPPAPTSEILVPSTTNARARSALVDSPALLREAGEAVATDHLLPADTPLSTDLARAVDAWRRTPVVVVHQSTFPAVTAPLGWVLSAESMETMDHALDQQATGSDAAGAVDAVSLNGSLADLLRLVTPGR